MFKKTILKTIKFYQKTISPDHGYISKIYKNGYCKFTPSCSQYCYESVNKYGSVRGMMLGIWRIIRCNPLSKGGWDPVK